MYAWNAPARPRPEYRSPCGLAEMRTEDPGGIQIVLVEVPLATLSAVTRSRLDRQGKRPLCGMSARSQSVS